MLEHDDVVGDCQRERAARSAFADDRCNDRHAGRRELVQAARNRFGLGMLFRRDTRVGPFRVDERDDRKA